MDSSPNEGNGIILDNEGLDLESAAYKLTFNMKEETLQDYDN